ncbi:cAMP-dependent protein kinase catalytic subunit,cAMP-dependent protein kinase type 2,Putative serine/threonine-protein kinase PRKY,cGMP-dependent protein kinase 2,cAMP-dependent protein kinase type 3,cAMP-dependent protein kinase catalytic subunit gamma,Ribosomal protein S6 kinase beta-1,cAMP-dependent protein kinase catalytic subunit alpha,Ribosomal protein S6 kinase beta,Protein kinase 3,cGMP-dependent protein kinase, isozyme 2 forms cD5/T2,Serine/threonine-protein kinase sck2,cGMP-dependent protein kina|uniref:cGMP-dependent protein kinase n=1 Tax=Mytilus coruscus TaxID=42192 RepID=A0A6J8D3H5_MYTCO|nr:cAMP-dependent protein kinase catalytic subunit,cAMP-dependent protein kinase type 2,Putative serine/threonine-protein kinase PRKY,cGMP-dependent protein kinase 2,cAMP-dependent protein kinase type 3,cAMP-dependent protein kinase catalytic subunit gamma,Ribosomal protein S6 kinase beta-1,cAMP-dependent protein kinase catalytic subunit alpha,Ribosomal protein S6 kinase beta,Protein kinase 3,cGMP-dependent protein kinase, isozyme 2 forms cD5/T2,Serine/threonine-protein kinase sck2,cGMP-dependent p
MPLPNHNSESNKSNTSVLNKTGTGKTPASNRAPGVYHIAHVAPSGNRMGNGASSTHIVIDGEQIDVVKLKHLVPELRKEIRNRDSKIQRYEGELVEKCKQLEEKDVEICKLRAEVDKLQSVLQIKVHKDAGKPDILATIQEDATMAGQETRTKKQGVSGESSNANQNSEILELKHHDKDFRSKQLIKDAIHDNDFLKNLDSTQVREIVDCMYEKKIKQGHYIIREGDAGQHLYVSADGELEVLKSNKVLGKMTAGRAFGELAILYNCTRTASVRALTDIRVWVLDRRVFQAIMMKTGLQRQEENIKFLRSVPLLQNLPTDKLAKIADVLEVDFYHEGDFIIREGAVGDTFFIINKGEVQVTQKIAGFDDPKEIRKLDRGQYFGEKALLSEDRRTANVIALAPGVECLTVDRESFNQLIGDLNELKEKDYGDEARGAQRISGGSGSDVTLSPVRDKMQNEFSFITLDQLEIVATLGMGGFGRVELVQLTADRSNTFALKCLKKKHIVDTRQQEHIYSEKKIMSEARSLFIARLYKTFKDVKYVYMLMEVCLGGELWTILRDRGCFDEITARFCISCVIEAFRYLHDRGIIYRDLKPENLLLDSHGYVKLVDFGFAKKIGQGRKTWTFCGTPEYVAPEIILNRGHDRAADYWSLGILMFELLTGSPPFAGSDPMKTYNIILKGIDVVEFPRRVGKTATMLIKKLCRDSPVERLGYGKGNINEIKKHKWFQGFDWEGLQTRSMVPPIVPKIKGSADFSNFDNYPKNSEVPPDETSGWDINF